MKTVLTTQAELRDTKHIDGVCFVCSQCGETKPVQTSGGTGYGYNKASEPVCYACCGLNDAKEMRETGKAVLYLEMAPLVGPNYSHGNYGDCTVSNWPGTLKIKGRFHKGAHNIAGSRYDVWFVFGGNEWYGVQYGENTQICRCKQMKRKGGVPA